MKKPKQIVGKRYGKQTVIGLSDRKGYLVMKCDCGTVHEARRDYVMSGRTKSCGCLRKEHASELGKNLTRYSSEKAHSSNSTGVRGVQQLKDGVYRAHICVNYDKICLGRYKTLEEATKARKRAEEKYYTPIIERGEI